MNTTNHKQTGEGNAPRKRATRRHADEWQDVDGAWHRGGGPSKHETAAHSQNVREAGEGDAPREITFDKLAIGQIFEKAYPSKNESPYQMKTGKKSSQYCNRDGSPIGCHHLQIMDLPVFEVSIFKKPESITEQLAKLTSQRDELLAALNESHLDIAEAYLILNQAEMEPIARTQSARHWLSKNSINRSAAISKAEGNK